MRDLLICAVFDFTGASSFDAQWERMVASLRLGKAGPIRHRQLSGGAIAARRDTIPGTDNPQVTLGDFKPATDGSITLLSGRLQNAEALALQLAIDPALSHAAIYGAAHARWGADCDRMVHGNYAAIQLWPEKREIRLARSPLAAPPLHVWRDRSRIVVSSVPRTIFAAGKDAVIDPDRIADVALLNFGDGRASFYKGLTRIACGTSETHSGEGVRHTSFWSLDAISESDWRSAEDVVKAARSLLHQAVTAELTGIRKPAVSLSGGLDSQAVASEMLLQLPAGQRLRSYTAVPVREWLGPHDRSFVADESSRVRDLAAMYPALDPAFCDARNSQFGDDLEKMVLLSGWPTLNEMHMHWIHAIRRQAAVDGCDALFTGDFGDPGLSYDGLTGPSTWLRQLKFGPMLRGLSAIEASKAQPRSLGRSFISDAVLPNLPTGLRSGLEKLRGYDASPFASWCPLDPESDVGRRALERASDAQHDLQNYRPPSASAARARMLAPALSEGAEIELGLRLLHGVECREPLAYRPLFEFAASLPDRFFLRDGQSRWLARAIVRGRVPDEVTQGRATGMQSADILERVRRAGTSLTAGLSAVGSEALRALDLGRINRDIEEWSAGRADRPYRWFRLASAAPRGIALARFVQFVEGRNHG